MKRVFGWVLLTALFLSPMYSTLMEHSGFTYQIGGSICSAQTPNVVFIMADDLGWGDLGCYGNDVAKTPRIDELRDDGILAHQYISCACVCSPARAAIVTGKLPASMGFHKALKSPDKNLSINQADYVHWDSYVIADMFKNAQYTTAHFGKWHLGSRNPGFSLNLLNLSNYGYDVSVCTACAHSNEEYDNQPDPQNPGQFYDPPERAWKSSEWIVDDAIDFITANQASPFYIQVWLSDPHAPVDPSPEQVVAAGFNEDKIGTSEIINGWTSATQAYYVNVHNMDYQIGRLLDTLDQLNLRDNTIVIFTSDNGPATLHANSTDHSGAGSSGPFRGGKQSIYEGGIRVPLIVRWPGVIAANSTTSHFLSAVDWFPTFAEIIGQPDPGLDGESILQPLISPEFPWERQNDSYGEWRFGNEGQKGRWVGETSPGAYIISPCGRWKLLCNRDGNLVGERLELYYLPDDPMESNNIANEFPAIAEDMKTRLRNWQAGLPACAGCEDEGDNSYPWP